MQEKHQQPVQISLEELFNTPEFQYAIDQRVNEKVFDATHPDFIPEYKTGSTPVDGKFTSDSPKAPRLRVPLTDEDVAFLNRPQPESEDLDATKRTPSMNMDFLTAPVEAPEPKELIRPFSEIVSDIKAEQSKTAKRHWETKSGSKSKNTKEVPAVDETKVAELFDELAARISTTEATDDIKLKLLISLQEKGNLSEQDITLVMDKLAENEDIITNAENEIDEVLKGTIMPSMKSLMSDGTRPESYFMDNNGEATPEYIAADSQINSILNSVNPIMREVVRNHANSRLQKLLDSATVAHKKYIVDNLDNLVVNNSPNQIDFASKQAEFELQQSEMIKSRDALAELSIQLRGKHSKKFNDELRAKYDKAFVDYKTKYDATSAIALEMLELKGAPKEYINDLAFDSALDEHKAFTKAEENAFNKINPKMGRVAKWWSKQGIAKKSLYGFSSSTVVTTAVGGALAVTGVGAVAGLAVVFGVKAARTAGMYQLNKNSRSITRFEGNSLVDNKIVESKMRSFKGSNSELGSAITSSLFDVIDTRVESDQKKNRKSLAFVLGSVALGTIAGSVINNVIFDKSAGTGTSGSTTTESGSGNSSSTTLLERPSTSSTVSESSPSSVPNPTETTVSPGSVTDSTSPASVPEVVPTVAPIENIPVVNPLEQQVTLHVPSGQGFENSIQEQFGLSDAQSYEAFTAMKPHLEGQINTYIENGDIRISSPGDMLLNPQASLALQQYLAQVNAESLTELAETT